MAVLAVGAEVVRRLFRKEVEVAALDGHRLHREEQGIGDVIEPRGEVIGPRQRPNEARRVGDHSEWPAEAAEQLRGP